MFLKNFLFQKALLWRGQAVKFILIHYLHQVVEMLPGACRLINKQLFIFPMFQEIHNNLIRTIPRVMSGLFDFIQMNELYIRIYFFPKFNFFRKLINTYSVHIIRIISIVIVFYIKKDWVCF